MKKKGLHLVLTLGLIGLIIYIVEIYVAWKNDEGKIF